MKFGIGQPVSRKEDPRFITGRGCYVDDLHLPNQAYAHVVYSPYAHADIVSIDTVEATAATGVLAVLTGTDLVADGMGSLPPGVMPEDVGGPKGYRTFRSVLAEKRVRYVGERVAVVIAETLEQARDAAELLVIDYAELPAVTSATAAVVDGAVQLHDGAANNTSFTLRMGNGEATAAAFERADHVARLSLFNNRLAACPLEVRGSIGDYNPADDRYTLHTSSQNPHGVRTVLAQVFLQQPESKVRVVARDVGGGFGMKTPLFPEDALVVWAARRLGRPVKWIATRSDAFIGDDDGRDQTVEAELALAADGTFLALRWQALYNVGAYIAGSGCVPVMFSLRLAQTAYHIPQIDVSNKAVLTNTAPTTPYRGAGRPEAVYIMERLIDTAARELNIDRVELRRRNFIAPSAMPYTTHTGFVYDSGEFAATLDKALSLADWNGFEQRRQVSAETGKLRGRGIAYYIDNSGIFNERMELRFDPSGSLTLLSGTFSHGQGHETAYAQMLSDWLGVPFESIRLEQGDTAQVGIGRGTYASRSMVVGGSALRAAADDVIDKGKRFAAHLLEADAVDVEFADGTFTIAGTDKQMSLDDVAKASFRPAGLPIELGVGLMGVGGFAVEQPSFPNGCHLCEVEIDRDTGQTRIDRYTVVDDIGVVINPLLAEGQIHGGIVQGVGQALLENVHYDGESGQLLSASLMDYALPRADDVPTFTSAFNEVRSHNNPIGVKGAGEGGTVAATPAVISAILDVLAPLGVNDIEMPASAERVWQALQSSTAQDS